MTATKRFLAFDIGASSGRAISGEWDGRRLACEDIYRFPNDPVQVNGCLHWDILRLFHEVRQGLLKYTGLHGNTVDAIGLDTWGVDFGLFDATGYLLGNPLHHRDSGFAGVAEELKALVGGYELYSQTGVMIEQVCTATQLYALARAGSSHLGAAKGLLMVPSILNYFLTGQFVDEFSSISNTGLVGYRDGTPLTGFLEKMGVDSGLVPDTVAPGGVLGELLPALKHDTGLTSAPVIACATHDSASAVISVPADDKTNWAFLSCGTWSVLGVETGEPVTSRESYDAGLTTAATADGKFMTRMNVTGLWIVQEMRRLWRQAGDAMEFGHMVDVAECATQFTAVIDVADPMFINPPDMLDAILGYLKGTGQLLPNNRGEMLRVVFESMALNYRRQIETISRVTGSSVEVLHVVGGGARNRLLCQLTANALGIPVLAGPVEATAMGNMLIQIMASGEAHSVDEGRMLLRPSFDVTEYAPQDTNTWDEAYASYLNTI